MQDSLKTIFEKYRSTDYEISFSAWAYQVVKNRLLTHAATTNRRERRRVDMTQVETQASTEEIDPDLERRLLICLERINRAHPRHARILNLHHQGYSQVDICERVGLTRTNFYTILSRARTALEECLKKGETK